MTGLLGDVKQWALVLEGGDGGRGFPSRVYLYPSRDAAEKGLQDYVKRNGGFTDEDEADEDFDMDDAIREYFDAEREDYSIGTVHEPERVVIEPALAVPPVTWGPENPEVARLTREAVDAGKWYYLRNAVAEEATMSAVQRYAYGRLNDALMKLGAASPTAEALYDAALAKWGPDRLHAGPKGR
jgi:hypothetical protein